MKKAILLFTVAAFFLTLATNAQFVKGNMFAEGGLGNLSVANNKVRWEETSGSTTTVIGRTKENGFSIGLMPRFGFFVSNNLAIGATLGLNYASNKSVRQHPVTSIDIEEDKFNAFTLEFMPFARLYFGKNNNTRFYGQIGGGIGTNLSRKEENKEIATGDTYKVNYTKKPLTVSGEAIVGVNHFVATNVAVNAGLGFRYNSTKYTYTTTSTSGSISFTDDPIKNISKGGAFIWNVGFTMFIPCKKKK